MAKVSSTPDPGLAGGPRDAAPEAVVTAGATRDLAARAIPAVQSVPPAFGQSKAADLEPGPAELTIELVNGDVTQIKAPFTVVGRYLGTSPAGTVKQFDNLLDSWIGHAIELGILRSELGEISFIPARNKKIHAENVVLAGMGEPGTFTYADLKYVMTNVAFAIKALGGEKACMTLIGSGGGGIRNDRVLRALIEGFRDGLKRFSGPATQSFYVILVVRNPRKFDELHEILKTFGERPPVADMAIKTKFSRRHTLGDKPAEDSSSRSDSSPEEPTTRLTIGRVTDDSAPADLAPSPPGPGAFAPVAEVTLRFSALADSAVIPVRDVVIQDYFHRRLTERLRTVKSRKDLDSYGHLLTHYLFPEDFSGVIEESESLTLVLDSQTASMPWEMAGIRGTSGTRLFGPDLKLTRQFQSALASRPGITPPLDGSLRVLVIADPARDPHQLPGARAEGLGVLEVFQQVQDAWKDKIRLEVVARIGPESGSSTGELEEELGKRGLRKEGGVVVDFQTCDPLEILSQILDEPFDIIHYAGHGIFDTVSGRKGWVFDADCVLSAREIFKMRQLPRLIFANACRSAEVDGKDTIVAEVYRRVSSLRQHAGLAEAFFEKGVRNYIGAGWAVDDEEALQFATSFYRQVLGIFVDRGDVKKLRTAPPATLGESLAKARKDLLEHGDHSRMTWGAYQHYGQVNTKLLPFVNIDVGEEGDR